MASGRHITMLALLETLQLTCLSIAGLSLLFSAQISLYIVGRMTFLGYTS